MVKIELPMIFFKDMNQSKTNLHFINLKKKIFTQHQPITNVHNASFFNMDSIVQELLLLPAFPNLSFCTELKGEVAESIIQKIILVLRKGRNYPRRWVMACKNTFPTPSKFPSLTSCQ